MSDLGDRLRKARVRKNYSQVMVREKTGIHNKTLSGYETGRNEPDYETLNILAGIYDVNVQWLLTGEDIDLQMNLLYKGLDQSRTRVIDPDSPPNYSNKHKLVMELFPKLSKVLNEYNLDIEDPETIELLRLAVEFIHFTKGKK